MNLHNNIVSPQEESGRESCHIGPGITTFRTWRSIPKDQWRTAKEWKQASRKVKDGEKPKGRMICTSVVSGLAVIAATPESILYRDDEHAEVITKQWPLYHFSQTQLANISRRTLAIHKYLEIFFRPARKDQYLIRQRDLETDVEAWATVSRKGLDILDKTTWGKESVAKAVINLNEADKRIIEAGLADLLGPRKHRHLACDLAIAMAQLVHYKMNRPVSHVREKAISYEYWKKFLESLGIQAGNRNKVAKIIAAAKNLGIIAKWCGHSRALHRATIYEVGRRMKKYVRDAGGSEEHIYKGSILFAYHFWDEDVNNDERTRRLLGMEATEEAWA